MQESSGLTSQILDVDRLPSLPQTLVDLIDECNKNDVDIQALGEKVARDVFISARVLQLVNSAFIGARSTFSDIVQAVIYLGVDTTRNLAVSVAVHETLTSSVSLSSALNLNTFWHHSFLTAVLARSLALTVGGVDPSEAYLGGLLHDVGKLLLYNQFPDKYEEIFKEKTPIETEERERQVLGICHSEAAGLLIRHWRLKQEIADAVLAHHCDFTRIKAKPILAKVLFCADRLSHCPLPDVSSVAESVCDLINIKGKNLSDCCAESLAMVDEIAAGMGIGIKKDIEKSQKDPPRSSRRRIEKGLTDRVLTFSRLNGFLDNLVKAETLDEVFQVIERSLHILFAVDGCLFLLPDDSGGFIVQGSQNNPFAVKAKDLRIADDDQDPGMIAHSLRHHNLHDSFSFAEKNGLSATDHTLLEIFQTDCMLAAPLVIAGRDPGLLLVGTGRSGLQRMEEGRETLLLLSGYSGMRLRLEATYQKYAADLAATRVAAVTEIAKSLAHEISNPIAILQNYLALLGMKLDGRPDIRADLDIIDKEIGRIGEINDQLRDLSSQQSRLELEPVNLDTLLSDVVTFFRQSLSGMQGIDLALDLPEELPHPLSNGTKIRQIIGNLIKNAIEAIEKDGRIWVQAELIDSTAGTSRAVKISVEDNGPGVCLPNIDDIFIAGITTKKGRHAGLGLAIAARLASQLGGTLNCVKQQQGGMAFSLFLPV